jgi:hypothetical protein
MKMSRKRAVTTWTGFAMDDFLIAFFALEAWRRYQPFFLAQGVEKICKAYLIGQRYSEYEMMDFEKAKTTIHKIAKDLSHGLNGLIKEVQKTITGISGLITKGWDGFTGDQIIDALQAGYTEVRYPVPISISRKHPVRGERNMYWDPLMSSGLEKFSFAVSKAIIDAIEKEYRLKIPRSNVYNTTISDRDWTRFFNLFFKSDTKQ